MKVGIFELSIRLEDWLGKEIEKTKYAQYVVFVCSETHMYELLENGNVYDVITFETEAKKISRDSDEFLDIINELERKRTIVSRYERMLNFILKNSPELLEEELPDDEVVTPINEYLLLVGFVLLFINLLFFSDFVGWIQELITTYIL